MFLFLRHGRGNKTLNKILNQCFCASEKRKLESLVQKHTSVSEVLGVNMHLITENSPLFYYSDEKQLPFPEPYWAFCWPGGLALAKYILDSPDIFRGKTIFDFGSGCGITSIVAASVGCDAVVANDIDPFAGAALSLNLALNNHLVDADRVSFMIEDKIDNLSSKSDAAYFDQFDIILCGDMLYDPAFSGRLMSVLSKHKCVIFGDPGRICCPKDIEKSSLLKTYPFGRDGFPELKVFKLTTKS